MEYPCASPIGTDSTAQSSHPDAETAVSDLTVETVLDAYVTSGSTRISDFKGGSATVRVKHTLKAAEQMKTEGDFVSGMTDAEPPSCYAEV